jgi:hypothetical protein
MSQNFRPGKPLTEHLFTHFTVVGLCIHEFHGKKISTYSLAYSSQACTKSARALARSSRERMSREPISRTNRAPVDRIDQIPNDRS